MLRNQNVTFLSPKRVIYIKPEQAVGATALQEQKFNISGGAEFSRIPTQTLESSKRGFTDM